MSNIFEGVTSREEFNEALLKAKEDGSQIERFLCKASFLDNIIEGRVYVKIREEFIFITRFTTFREESTGERVTWDLKDNEIELYLTKL